MKKLLVFVLIFSHLALAEDVCTAPVQYLTRGTPAQCTGYLFSPKQEQSVRLIKESLDNLQQQFSIQTDKINLLTQDISFFKDQETASQQQTQIWQKASQTCSEELQKTDSDRFLKDMLFFGAGIITVLIAGLALKQVQ